MSQFKSEKNCVYYTHPHLSPYFSSIEDSKNYSHGSNKRVRMRCPHCKITQKEMIVGSLVRQGFSCPLCKPTTSYPERFVAHCLRAQGVEFIHQYKIKSEPYLYDFFLPGNKTIIEVHGKQHYQESQGYYTGKLEEIQYNDQQKERAARNNGMVFVVIDGSKSEFDFLWQSLKKANLSNLSFSTGQKEELKTKITYEVDHDNINIIKDYKDGKKILELSNTYNKAPSSISYLLKRAGVATRIGRGAVVDLENEVLYSSIEEAGIALSITNGAVLYRIKQGIFTYLENFSGSLDSIEIHDMKSKKRNKQYTWKIEKKEGSTYKSIDLSNMPKTVKGRKKVIDWENAKNCTIPYQYQEEKGKMLLISTEKRVMPNQKVRVSCLINFKGVEHSILNTNLTGLSIAKIVKAQNPNSRKVVNLNTQHIFKSILEAEGYAGLKQGNYNISAVCNGNRPTAGKHPVTGEPLKWMYYEDYVEKYGTEGLTEYVEGETHI